jgi:hypothetical protein
MRTGSEVSENELGELCDEALANTREDRERLKKFVDRLVSFVSSQDTDDAAANMATALCEPIVRAHDTLVKVNAQIVDIAQIKMKKFTVEKRNEVDAKDAEAGKIYDAVEADFNGSKPHES